MNTILDLYDTEVRNNPVENPGTRVVQDGLVIRTEGAANSICSWRCAADQVEDTVKQQAEHFRRLGEMLIWRVYEHDTPANIEDCLRRQGFAASPSGTLMVLPLGGAKQMMLDHDVRRVTSSEALRDYLDIASAAFGEGEDGLFEHYEKILSEESIVLFVVYQNNEPVASARLEVQVGTSFGLLFGGAVLPRHRGKGFYRALVTARKNYALQHGLKYLTTEAWETSRPILEALGFLPLVKETTWILPVEEETGPS